MVVPLFLDLVIGAPRTHLQVQQPPAEAEGAASTPQEMARTSRRHSAEKDAAAHVFLARQTRGELWDPSLFWIATVETTRPAEMFDPITLFL